MMPAICFDVSDRSIKYLELKRKKGSLYVSRFGLFSIPDGIIEKGEIKQKEKLANLLKNIKKELKSDYVIASLPEEKVFLSRIKFPVIALGNLRESISLQLDEYVPLSSEEAIFDFDIISNHEKEGHFDINLIAFSKDFVCGYRDVFSDAGFTLVAFEMEAHAFARSIVPTKEEKTVMVIDFGRTRATFAIVSGGKVQYTTTVDVAGGEIDKAIMNNLKISKEEAEKVKREKGFTRVKGNEDLFNSILPIASIIKDEALKQIAYWNSHEKDSGGEQSKVSKIILCGGESTVAGLLEYLSYDLKIKAEIGNPWVNVASFNDYIPDIEKGDSLAYATVIGLALRQWIGK